MLYPVKFKPIDYTGSGCSTEDAEAGLTFTSVSQILWTSGIRGLSGMLALADSFCKALPAVMSIAGLHCTDGRLRHAQLCVRHVA